jgi:hypothetical protein
MKKDNKAGSAEKGGLFTLEVVIFSGPMMENFVEENPVISRTIQIRGDQTLAQLHKAIFKAFDRWEEHLYEFQVGGKGPRDRKAKRYGLAEIEEGSIFGDSLIGDVKKTTIGSLGLKKDDRFGYWFDFGDDWWHQINVAAIENAVPQGTYPKLIKRQGQSPPQYPDMEEDE